MACLKRAEPALRVSRSAAPAQNSVAEKRPQRLRVRFGPTAGLTGHTALHRELLGGAPCPRFPGGWLRPIDSSAWLAKTAIGQPPAPVIFPRP